MTKDQSGICVKARLKSVLFYAKEILLRALLALLIGLLGGCVGALLLHGVRFAAAAYGKYPFLLYLLPIGGLCIAGLYRLCRIPFRLGTSDVICAARGESDLPPLMLASVSVSTFLTHLCGGSAGREGAALQLGGAVGAGVARVFRVRDRVGDVAVSCGMSAVFAAVFGTPLTAAVFVCEVVYVGRISRTLPYGIVSALAGFGVARALSCEPTAFALLGAEAFSWNAAWRVLLLAAAVALVSRLFCLLMEHTADMLGRRLPDPFLRIAVGGALVVGLTLVFGRAYGGSGEPMLASALAGRADTPAFALKALFTAITLGAGYRGGEIVPCFTIGGTFGCVAAPLVGLNPSFGAAIGVVAMFCGAVNCPLASLLLALELFGGESMPLFALAVGAASLFSGKGGLYRSQKRADALPVP